MCHTWKHRVVAIWRETKQPQPTTQSDIYLLPNSRSNGYRFEWIEVLQIECEMRNDNNNNNNK